MIFSGTSNSREKYCPIKGHFTLDMMLKGTIYIYICMYISNIPIIVYSACVHVGMYLCVCVCVCLCVCVCVCVCLCVCVCVRVCVAVCIWWFCMCCKHIYLLNPAFTHFCTMSRIIVPRTLTKKLATAFA